MKPQVFLFKYRSYTPIPFVLLMLIFIDATLWSILIGFSLSIIGEMIRFWGVSYAGSETRTTGDVGGSKLVISGPFGYVRNPLYIGNMIIYLGLGIMSFALFPYLQIGAMLFFIIQYSLIVKEEENYLQNTFGEDYKNYLKNVPRFFPKLTPYNPDETNPVSFNPKAGFKSERRSLQAIIIVALLIVVLWYLKSNQLI